MSNNSKYSTEKILSVHHWNDTLFSFKTTRQDGLRFENGQFVMIGLEVDGRPLARAYSVASPNYDEHLEFLSIKVQNGPLTSRLQHIKVGDELLVSRKPTGTLVIHDLKPAKNLYLFSTGTGLAPYMSLIQDIEVYDRFEKVILVHGVRKINDIAYKDFIENELPNNEFFGEENRTFINAGLVTNIYEEKEFHIGLPFFAQFNNTKFANNYIAVNNQSYTINHTPSNQPNTVPGGFAFGAGSGILFTFALNKQINFTAGYHAQYSKTYINTQLAPWGLQHSVFGRLVWMKE